MKLKYIQVFDKTKTNVYEIHIVCIHGDGDHYSTAIVECETESLLIERASIIRNHLKRSKSDDSWYDKYTWLDIEHDIFSDYNCFATPEFMQMYYWSHTGIKFKVEFDEKRKLP